MKHQIAVLVIGFVAVGFAQIIGLSESSGLFSATLGIGVYLAGELK